MGLVASVALVIGGVGVLTALFFWASGGGFGGRAVERARVPARRR